MPDISALLIPLVALIIALIVVAGLWYWWTSSQSEAPEKPPQEADEAPAPQAKPQVSPAGSILSGIRAGMAGIISTTSSTDAPPAIPEGVIPQGEQIEVLRLYRDLSSGALIVQIGRQKYYSLDEISEPQVRRRFLGNAEAMAQFAQLKQGDTPLVDWSAPSTVNQARPAYPVDAQIVPSVPPPPPPMMSSMPPPPPPMIMPVGTASTQPISGKPGEEPAPKSIAEEIEELLQYRLALDPVFAHRSIHIRSSGDGTIRVQVDNEKYEGVGDVKDADVRAFLQRVVQEWEARK